jgi:hypothetical protein
MTKPASFHRFAFMENPRRLLDVVSGVSQFHHAIIGLGF